MGRARGAGSVGRPRNSPEKRGGSKPIRGGNRRRRVKFGRGGCSPPPHPRPFKGAIRRRLGRRKPDRGLQSPPSRRRTCLTRPAEPARGAARRLESMSAPGRRPNMSPWSTPILRRRRARRAGITPRDRRWRRPAISRPSGASEPRRAGRRFSRGNRLGGPGLPARRTSQRRPGDGMRPKSRGGDGRPAFGTGVIVRISSLMRHGRCRFRRRGERVAGLGGECPPAGRPAAAPMARPGSNENGLPKEAILVLGCGDRI